MADIEFLLIDDHTELAQFQKELRWNGICYHVAHGLQPSGWAAVRTLSTLPSDEPRRRLYVSFRRGLLSRTMACRTLAR